MICYNHIMKIPTPDVELEMREDKDEEVNKLLKSSDHRENRKAIGRSIMFLKDKVEIVREQIGNTISN